MGLGVFIAKTLLERTGASVTFGNRTVAGGWRGRLRALAKPRLQGYIAADVEGVAMSQDAGAGRPYRPSLPARRRTRIGRC